MSCLFQVAAAQWMRDYVLELQPESEADRARRHQGVAERRRGPVVMVHRGATAAAPENTLLACATALDWGADGIEVDLRRTRDGVLVLFHDETLDRLTHGFGAVSQLRASELLALEPREAYGRPAGATPASFVQLLDLVRQRAALLHLDLKEPGLEDEVARWLDAADAWDHVVAINETHAPRLAREARVRPLRYKAPGLYLDRRDLDPDAVRAVLREPGEMILVGDPRVATQVLQRPQYRPVPLLRTYRLITRSPPIEPVAEDEFNPAAHLARLRATLPAGAALPLLQLLEAPVPEAGDSEADAETLRRRAARIVERAWAADQLGLLGRRHPDVIRALERAVRAPSPHPDWRYHALDGALAARALGRLRSTASAGVLIAALQSSGRRAAEEDRAPAEARFQMHLFAALGDLRCAAVPRRISGNGRFRARGPVRGAAVGGCHTRVAPAASEFSGTDRAAATPELRGPRHGVARVPGPSQRNASPRVATGGGLGLEPAARGDPAARAGAACSVDSRRRNCAAQGCSLTGVETEVRSGVVSGIPA